MDFPLFHFDIMGERMLMAIIAIIHVLINHTLAVGFIPLVAFMEYYGFKQKKYDLNFGQQWDELARKIMLVAFIITTSAGAMTGVGIWFAASLINPAAIGSLIRVFYFAWFTEWIVFVLEVVFIMIYFLTWSKSNNSEKYKRRHIKFGFALAVFSWLTMAIIVGILGFMMDPGAWVGDKTFFSGFVNPVYLPQLYFRTPLSMALGGSIALFLTMFFLKKGNPVRRKAITWISFWILIWTPVCFAGGFWYYLEMPDLMFGNMPTAVGTLAFQGWYDSLLYALIGAVVVSFLFALWGFLSARTLPKIAMIFPALALLIFLGSFERVREFVRKPYVIGEYMYANALQVENYPVYKKHGILKYATYSRNYPVNDKNKIDAGRDVFMIACSRCHTASGLNNIVTKFDNMLAENKELTVDFMKGYIPGMHKVWYFMPEFPGNEKELDALAHFIKHIEENPQYLEGAQTKGIEINPLSNMNEMEEITSSEEK